MENNKNNYCTLYLVRHGEAEWNRDNIVMGNTGDSPLTKDGIEQAKDTAEQLSDVHFDAIFSSDSIRTQQTAEIMRLERELAVQTTKLLRERSFGKYEGRPATDYWKAIQHQLEEVEKLSEKEQWEYTYGGNLESDEALAARFIRYLREIAVFHPGKTVLITTHSAIIRIFLMRVGWAKREELSSGSIKHAGYVKVLSDGVDFFVKEVVGVDKAEISQENN